MRAAWARVANLATLARTSGLRSLAKAGTKPMSASSSSG